MFRNSGRKIMGFVNFMFYLNLVVAILAVVAGTFFIHIEYGSIQWTLLGALGCIVVAAVYMLLVFLSLLCLYAFGELVQSSVDTKRILGEMQRSSERYSPQNYRDAIQVTSVSRNKPTIAERKAASMPVAPVAPAVPPEEPVAAVQSVAATETIAAPAREEAAEPSRPAFAFDYKTAAGAPGFGISDHAPRPLFCTKCGAKHEPGTANCRYCGTPLG